jgi:glycosyltransferase involved in cell wall biosynthesis
MAGGIPEVVADGETGFLVPVRDPAALADRIVRLLQRDDLRAAFGETGRQRVEQRFSAEQMVAATLAAYADVARVSRSASRPPRSDGSGDTWPVP